MYMCVYVYICMYMCVGIYFCVHTLACFFVHGLRPCSDCRFDATTYPATTPQHRKLTTLQVVAVMFHVMRLCEEGGRTPLSVCSGQT